MTTLTIIQTVGSPTCGPVRWTPRTMPCAASTARTFAATMPSVQVIFIAASSSLPSAEPPATGHVELHFWCCSLTSSGPRCDHEGPQRAIGRYKPSDAVTRPTSGSPKERLEQHGDATANNISVCAILLCIQYGERGSQMRTETEIRRYQKTLVSYRDGAKTKIASAQSGS